MTNKTQWGLHRAVPENARAVWGARGIFNARDLDTDTSWDLVYQGMWGETSGDKETLGTLLNKCRVFEASYRRFREKAAHGLIDRTSDEIHTLYDTQLLKVQCSTNSSFGYIYVSGWLEPLALPLSERTFDSGPDLLTWSNDQLPEIGDMVEVSMNGKFPATVIGYATESHEGDNLLPGSNYLFIVVDLLDPPDWWVNQTTERFKSDKPHGYYSYIMGREWKPQ